jgi:hypothetical protein
MSLPKEIGKKASEDVEPNSIDFLRKFGRAALTNVVLAVKWHLKPGNNNTDPVME